MAAWLKVEAGRKVVLTQPHGRTPPLALLGRPPSESFAELLSDGGSRWLDAGSGESATKVCVLEPGDVLWLPAMQWHATLNLAATLAVGGQAGVLTEQDRAAVAADMAAESEYCEAEADPNLPVDAAAAAADGGCAHTPSAAACGPCT